MFSDSLQAPRFITQPSASGSIVAEGRTKILQCQALGRDRSRIGRSYFLALGRGRSRIGRSYSQLQVGVLVGQVGVINQLQIQVSVREDVFLFSSSRQIVDFIVGQDILSSIIYGLQQDRTYCQALGRIYSRIGCIVFFIVGHYIFLSS